MRLRWIIVFVSIAGLHFAATAGIHVFALSYCRPVAGAGCQTLETLTTGLSAPLLPILIELTGGGFGWRRAMVSFAANSALVGALLTGVAWFLSRWLSGDRAS